MKKSILFVLTSASELLDGTPTGVWLEELAASYFTLLDAGHSVVLASPKGEAATIDPLSTEAPWLTPTGDRFLKSVKAMKAVAHTRALADIDPGAYDGVYFIGGAGTMMDFPDNAEISRLLGVFDGSTRPVASVCHGGSALLNERNGAAFASGRNVTVISDAEDRLAGFDKLLPFMPEGRLRAVGADVAVGEPFAAHIVEDGLLITGQNPASAGPVAERLLERLGGPAVTNAS